MRILLFFWFLFYCAQFLPPTSGMKFASHTDRIIASGKALYLENVDFSAGIYLNEG